MHRNDLIVRQAYAHLRGEWKGPVNRDGKPISGMCLALVREVVERGLNLPPFDKGHRWYRWKTHMVERPPGAPHPITDPWSRDMERSLREQGMAVLTPPPPGLAMRRYVDRDQIMREAIPGDLLFRWDTAKHKLGEYIGHVGIYMPGYMVLENINAGYRKAYTGVTRGPTRLGPIGEWPVTLVVRFDPDRLP